MKSLIHRIDLPIWAGEILNISSLPPASGGEPLRVKAYSIPNEESKILIS